MRIIYMLVAILCWVLPPAAAEPSLKLESVKKIWGEAPHCAFTDLTYWKGEFICAFREGRAHVATDGKIRQRVHGNLCTKFHMPGHLAM